MFKVVISLNAICNSPFEFATLTNLNNPKTVVWTKAGRDLPTALPSFSSANAEYSQFFLNGRVDSTFRPMTEEQLYEILKIRFGSLGLGD